jgi:hypothetical protein
VIFIDPPSKLGAAGRIEIEGTAVPRVSVLRYQPFFPYSLKFRARSVFDLLMRQQARRLVRAAGRPDLVWDFDNTYQFRDLSQFGASRTLFHLVDDVGVPGLGIKSADHVLYLHRSFCERAGGKPLADHEIGHGLGRMYADAALDARDETRPAVSAHVGFVGNLAAPWVDWTAVAEMVSRNPLARFTFWGPFPDDSSADADLRRLLRHPAIRFPGLTSAERIVTESHDVDVWLLPFRPDRLLGGALNSHKILEYLSTGRAVVMTWLEAYEGKDVVFTLPRSGGSLADLLQQVLANLEEANSPEMISRRRAFALESTYDRLLDRVLSVTETPEFPLTERSDAA